MSSRSPCQGSFGQLWEKVNVSTLYYTRKQPTLAPPPGVEQQLIPARLGPKCHRRDQRLWRECCWGTTLFAPLSKAAGIDTYLGFQLMM